MIYHITESCHMNCPHCMVEAVPSDNHATMEMTNSFLKFVNDMGSFKVGIAGGEPTEHPDFFNHLEVIAERLHNKSMVIIMTNGQWLFNNDYTNELARIVNKYGVYVQVSALKGIYPNQQLTQQQYESKHHCFKDGVIHLIENITCLEDLGRAKGKDWSHLGDLFKRKAPNCFNMYSIASSKHVPSLSDSLQILERNTSNFCKPLIRWNGDIHVGETQLCTKLGNIIDDSYEEIFTNLKKGKPCGLCGIQLSL